MKTKNSRTFPKKLRVNYKHEICIKDFKKETDHQQIIK